MTTEQLKELNKKFKEGIWELSMDGNIQDDGTDTDPKGNDFAFTDVQYELDGKEYHIHFDILNTNPPTLLPKCKPDAPQEVRDYVEDAKEMFEGLINVLDPLEDFYNKNVNE